MPSNDRLAEKLAHPEEVDAQAAGFDRDDQELEEKEKEVCLKLRFHMFSENNTISRIMRGTKISSLRLSRQRHPLASIVLKTALLPPRMRSRKVPIATKRLRSGWIPRQNTFLLRKGPTLVIAGLTIAIPTRSRSHKERKRSCSFLPARYIKACKVRVSCSMALRAYN